MKSRKITAVLAAAAVAGVAYSCGGGVKKPPPTIEPHPGAARPAATASPDNCSQCHS